MKRIILASESKRRKRLMHYLFEDHFETIPSTYHEKDNGLKGKDLVMHHALMKAKDVAEKVDDGIVIGCDTMVELEGEMLGKPADKEDAKTILRKQSGKSSKVVTGIAVIDNYNNKEYLDHEETKLKMKILTEKEIHDYVETGHPMDKAGAFGINGKGAIFVENIEGCYFNVIGFPIYKLYLMLQKIGINTSDYWSKNI